MRKPWATAAWRKRRAEFIKDKSCEWCGSKEYLTIDHLRPPNTQTEEDYLSFKDAKVLCRRCAYARLKGMRLCPKCKKKYVPWRFSICFDCLSPERKQEILEKKYDPLQGKSPCPLIDTCVDPDEECSEVTTCPFRIRWCQKFNDEPHHVWNNCDKVLEAQDTEACDDCEYHIIKKEVEG